MDPFLADHLSQIHEADTLYDSRFSATRQNFQQNWFQQQRTYAKSTLNSWGITVGELHYSRDNEVTLRCLVELIGYRQKELQFRSRNKDELNTLQFQRDKYRSFMQQGQRTIQEHMKRIGSLQNELLQLKAKLKKNQTVIKKERDQDRKMIAMLKNKNQQILHQIKKKEQQTNRIKQQMKKNVVGDKTPSKNSFDVFQTLTRSVSKQRQASEQKYAFLLQRNQRQLSIAVKQNTILRQKIYQIRQSLVQFHIWIDREIFGEQLEDSPMNYHHKFYINHNLLFKKESLTEELDSLLELTKDGIAQIRDIYKHNRTPPKLQIDYKEVEEQMELNFKKKAPQRKEIRTDRTSNQLKERQSKNRTSITKNIQNTSQHPTPRINKQPYQCQTQVNIKHLSSNSNNKFKNIVQTKKIGTVVTKAISSNQLSMKSAKDLTKILKDQFPQQQQLLSEFSESQDESIVSHISIQKIGKSKFDKWDILYNDQK